MEETSKIRRINRRPAVQREAGETSYFDFILLFVVIVLIAFGLVMLYSVTSYEAMNKFDDSMYYLKRQLRGVLIGAVVMAFFALVNYHRWIKWVPILYVLTFLLELAVFIPGIGVEINESRRWIGFGGFTLQPSEVTKLVIIITMAALISKIPGQLKKFSAFVKLVILAVVLVVPVAVTDLSTAVIIFATVIAMLFVASPKLWHFLVGGALVAVAGTFFILFASYRLERFLGFLGDDEVYQTQQALYALGSGGVFGKGLGESLQKLGYVPEAENDMILSIIGEELGLFGVVCVIVLFVLLLWRYIFIANNAPDLFGAMIAVGAFAHIALQVVLNIAVVTDTIPNTGVTLPFISYGGTSAVFLMAEVGLVLGVSSRIRLKG